MWHWVFLAVVVIAAFYVWTYFRFPLDVAILQTSLSKFHFDLLTTKQPVVIDDRVIRMDDIKAAWFPSNFAATFRLEGSALNWHLNRYKYLLLHAEQEGDIYLYPAGKALGPDGLPDPGNELLAVHLLPGQMLIVPFRYRYLVMQPMSVTALGVHDYVTYVIP